MNEEELFSSEELLAGLEEDQERIQKTRSLDHQVNQLDEQGQQGDPYATQSADQTFDEAFPGAVAILTPNCFALSTDVISATVLPASIATD